MSKTKIAQTKIKWRLLTKILNHLHFRVNFSDEVDYIPRPEFKTIYVNVQSPSFTVVKDLGKYWKGVQIEYVQGIAHEIGHCLVVPKQRKRRKNFAIPDELISQKSRFKYDVEESKACIIEKEILRRLGIKARKPLTEVIYQQRDYRYSDVKINFKEWWSKEGLKLVDNLFIIATKGAIDERASYR